MAPPTLRRQYNTALLWTYGALAALGLWFMRIYIVFNGVPIGFDKMIETNLLPNGIPIKKHFTGIMPLDEGLSFLNAAFIYGPSRWNEAFYWQQLHFLLQVTALVVVMNVEACRERNRSSWLRFTALWAAIYQNIGSAVVMPLWWVPLHRNSAEKSYFASGRAVPLPYTRVMLPATILIYLVPTVALFIPGHDLITLQNILAFWQLAPVLVNVPLWLAAPFVSSTPSAASKSKNADLPHLKVLYVTVFLVSVASQWYTIYGISTSTNPSVSFASVFLPSTSRWRDSMDAGVMYIFQWDWIIDASVYILPSWIAMYDVQRLLHGAATSVQLIQGAVVITLLTIVGGPGAAIAAVWAWREEKLALVESRLGSGKKGI